MNFIKRKNANTKKKQKNILQSFTPGGPSVKIKLGLLAQRTNQLYTTCANTGHA